MLSEALSFISRSRDDERGYHLSLPRPFPANQACQIGRRYADKIGDTPKVTHIGLLDSGIYVAVPGMQARLQAGYEDELWPLDVCNPENPDKPLSGQPVVVDNSVKDGTTLARAVGFLHRRFIEPETFVKLVDYQDETEALTQKWILKELGMRTISLFAASELLENSIELTDSQL